MNHPYYHNSLQDFLNDSKESIMGNLTHNAGDIDKTQSIAWERQIDSWASLSESGCGWTSNPYML